MDTSILDVSRTAIPWYKSLVLMGGTGGFGTSLGTLFQAWRPGVPILQQLDTLATPAAAVFSSLMVILGRVTSTAQPLTTSQAKADQITAARS
jgi:hypothetical protein